MCKFLCIVLDIPTHRTVLSLFGDSVRMSDKHLGVKMYMSCATWSARQVDADCSVCFCLTVRFMVKWMLNVHFFFVLRAGGAVQEDTLLIKIWKFYLFIRAFKYYVIR